MAIQKKSLIGKRATKPSSGAGGKNSEDKAVGPAKSSAARKLAVAKLSTAKLMALKKLS